MEELFREIERCVSFKDFSKAKELAQKIEPDSMKHNMLGVLFYQEGELDNALEHFQKALKLDPTNDDVLFNLSKVLFEKKDFFESWRYLTRIKDKTWEVYDLLGDTQLAQNNVPMALHYYSKAAQLSDIPEMKEKFEQAKAKFKRAEKIAIFCLPGLDNFIKDIAQVLSNVFEVKLVVTTDGNQIVQAYKWADVVWLEWANELAVEITNKLEKMGKKIVCRLHSYEALTNAFLGKIDWRKIDALILVAEHMREVIATYHPKVYEQIKDRTVVIHNGLDLNKFKFKPREKGYNIAVVAHINYKKDPAMWLQVMGQLVRIDPRYNLSIAGDFQDLRYHFYFTHLLKETGLEKNVVFQGYVKNIEEFLEDKNFVLSTSVHESFGYSIAEAMACGIKPLIHNFCGSESLWPKDLIFNFIHEISTLVSSEYNSEAYRRFVENRYSLEKQISGISKIFLEVVSHVPHEEEEADKNVSGRPFQIFDPVSHGLTFDRGRYDEDELERKLGELRVVASHVPVDLLVNNVVPLMVNFLEEFIVKGVPYQKTVYYAFVKDLYEKGYIVHQPDLYINRFIQLFEAIKRERRILKPVVAFYNDGTLVAFDPLNRERVKVPDDVVLLVTSGRHRVAIAKFLGMNTVATRVVLNRFVSEKGTVEIHIAYWQRYLERFLPVYMRQVQEIYVGSSDGGYHDRLNPMKKEIVEKFVLSLKPKTLIDIGCNRGELSYHFIKHGVEVLGVDISPREKLRIPSDYKFLQLDIGREDLPYTADVILFLSVYQHLFYNYGKDKADDVFYKLFNKCHFLVFDSGHPEEKWPYPQGWLNEMRKYFKTERELLDHFGLPYIPLGKWYRLADSPRTIVVFENKNFS